MLYEVHVQTDGKTYPVEVEAEAYKVDKRTNQHIFYGEQKGEYANVVASFSSDRVVYFRKVS